MFTRGLIGSYSQLANEVTYQHCNMNHTPKLRESSPSQRWCCLGNSGLSELVVVAGELKERSLLEDGITEETTS